MGLQTAWVSVNDESIYLSISCSTGGIFASQADLEQHVWCFQDAEVMQLGNTSLDAIYLNQQLKEVGKQLAHPLAPVGYSLLRLTSCSNPRPALAVHSPHIRLTS